MVTPVACCMPKWSCENHGVFSSHEARKPACRMPSPPNMRVFAMGMSSQSQMCGCCGLMMPNSVRK